MRGLVCGVAGMAGALFLGACTSPMNLALMEPPDPGSRSVSRAGGKVVSIGFLSIEDLRPEFSKQSIGLVQGRAVKGPDVLPWIGRALGGLGGTRFSATPAAGPGGWTVKPALRQFYAGSLTVSKTVNVVLELEIRPPTGGTVTRVYRGSITAVDWWNTSGEIEQSFHEAFSGCLRQMAADLDLLVETASGPNEAAHTKDN